MNLDKIYVIAINITQEKIDDITNRLSTLGVYDVPFEIVSGFNGKTDKLPEGYSVYPNWAAPELNNKWWNNSVTTGEIGCAISHIMVWNKIIEEGHNRVLILEEDFKVNRGLDKLTEQELEKAGEFDLLYLGRYRFDDGLSKKISNNLEIPGNSYNTHAYSVTREGAQKLIDGGLHKNLIAPDEYVPAMYMEHRRMDISSIFKPTLSVLSTTDDFISQTSNSSTSTTQENKETMNKFEILDDSDWEAWKSKYIVQTIAQGQWDLLVDEHRDTSIFEFPLFTRKFCEEAVALAESLDKWTIDRHEFYPTNDVLLPEIGLDKIYSRVLKEIVYPLSIHLWDLEGVGWSSMYSENFLARYTTDRQSHLSLHHDFSNITMVVKLNDEFSGGGTWFPKYKILSNPKEIGTATLHPGMVTHLHGARPITTGKRYICVSFMRKNK